MRPWWVVALIVGGDQLTKCVIRLLLSPAQSLPVLPPVFHLTLVQNTGAAFGLFPNHSGWFVLVSLGVGAWVGIELVRMRHRPPLTTLALALILGGAVGNLIDRLRFGYVIDFLDFRIWPVFNLADSSITIGVGLLLWHTMRRSPRRPSRANP